MKLEELARTLRANLNADDREVLARVAETDWQSATLDLSDPSDRSFAAHATALGAALFYSFANFCAIAAHPHLDSVRRVNRLKGRNVDQVGSVSTTRDRIDRLFDWDRLPAGLTRERVRHLIDDFYVLGPMGFRGPAATGIPDQVMSLDDGVRTTQIIAPGLPLSLQRADQGGARPDRRGLRLHHLRERFQGRDRAGRGRALRRGRDAGRLR
jgi:hypothetical protein